MSPQPKLSPHAFLVNIIEFTQRDGRKERKHNALTLVCDKQDKAITCVLYYDLHFTENFSGHLLKDLFKGLKGGLSLTKRCFKQNY